MLCSDKAEEGKIWVETINSTVQQLEANFRTLRKESSNRRPIRKRQLKNNDSLMRKFYQRKLTNECPPCSFDVEVLRSENAGTPSPPSSLAIKSQRGIKLPKWPGGCPVSPFAYSPRKLLKLMAPSSPVRSPTHEVLHRTVSLPISFITFFFS